MSVDGGVLLGDLKHPKQELVVATGGKGGKGNARFATPTWQAPDIAEKGEEGQSRHLRLELKLLADVGLVGFPNAGKSTLLSRISAARPKIADYPFTTLAPHLGIVTYDSFKSYVVADIPGLITGAHEGKGLGDRFLRHIERTRILVFLVDVTTQEIPETYHALLEELKLFNPDLLKKTRILAVTKVDLALEKGIESRPLLIEGVPCHYVSSVTGEGIPSLLGVIEEMLSGGENE
jgi:GTP-binding protein